MRSLIILAGFPYHQNPHLYRWLWVFILLPFLPESTLNELADKYGQPLRELYLIIQKYPDAFSRLVELITIPLFFKELEAYYKRDESYQSRHRPVFVVDDTQSEKFGKCIAFVKKLFDHAKRRYIHGHNMVLVLVGFGDFVFPLAIMLWRPKGEDGHESKNRLVTNFLKQLKKEADKRGMSLQAADIVFDSAYTAHYLVEEAKKANLRVTSKAKSRYVFDFEGQELTVNEIINKVKDRNWEPLHHGSFYQRYQVRHARYGEVVLIVRKRRCANGKEIYDILFSTQLTYRAFQIDDRYRLRWEIEMHFKYYKQYLKLGKSSYRHRGSVQSAMYCVALAGLVVALYRRQLPRRVSFKAAVKQLCRQIQGG